MELLAEIVRHLNIVVLAALAVLTFFKWRQAGGEPGRWATVAFTALALLFLERRVVPDDPDAVVLQVLDRVVIAFAVAFPYFIYRFTTSFKGAPRLLHLLVTLLAGASIVWTLFLPRLPVDEDPRPSWFVAFIVVVLAQWVLLSVISALFLWRGGRGQPLVARARMRALSVAAITLSLAILIAGFATGERPPALDLAFRLLVLLSAGFFFLGFAPPPILRTIWRRPELGQLAEAELRLMESVTAGQVADVLLPQVTRLVAAQGALLVDGRGELVGVHGMDHVQARERAASSSGDEQGRGGDGSSQLLTVPMASGRLVLLLSPYTPFFGQDETDMVRRFAVLAELGIVRADLLERERRGREQLMEAQRIARLGSWQWDTKTGVVDWSDQMYRIHGIDPGVELTYETAMESIHPDDRRAVEEITPERLAAGEGGKVEYRIVRPTGEVRFVQGRGKAVVDDSGQPVKMFGTVQDITERKREESFRQRFIADAAHELRTPMTTLVGFVEFLASKRHMLTEQQIESAIDAMSRAGNRLSTLVANLLDLGRLQEAELDIALEPVSVADVARHIVAAVPPPEGTSVELKIEDDVRVLADPKRLDQVLSNLLSNAYRYGGPQVVLESASRNGNVTIAVADNGPGVEEKLVPTLFEAFARGDASSAFGGSGLGLAIVKMLVEAHDGRIWLDTKHRGARFVIELQAAVP